MERAPRSPGSDRSHGPESAPRRAPGAPPAALQRLLAAGNRRAALVLANAPARHVQRMDPAEDSAAASSSSAPRARPTLAFLPPRTNVFYKAVTGQHLAAIQANGLDPARAGGIGSSQFQAAAQSGRPYSAADTQGQFLTPSEGFAHNYAHGGKVMLRVTLPPELVEGENLFWTSATECYARQVVPPACLEYETAPGQWAALANWDGDLANVHDRDDDD